jgi:hypothetical protein
LKGFKTLALSQLFNDFFSCFLLPVDFPHF